MSDNDTIPDIDQRLLNDLRREYGLGWERLLARFGLPSDIGIVNTMTLGEAKDLAAKKASQDSGRVPGAMSVLSASDLDSVKAAIREEIASAGKVDKSAWLEIDGVQHLSDTPGCFVYRLLLSSPVHFGADQTVTFHTRNPKDTIQAVIVRSDDEGLVVECQKPLPTDAKLLNLSFDPTFILRGLPASTQVALRKERFP